jgi:hypothetical protein
MTQRKPALATRVSPVVNTAVRRLTEALGITISEYLRKLILDDLESKQLFEDEFKATLERSEPKARKETPGEMLRKWLSEPDEENNHERW